MKIAECKKRILVVDDEANLRHMLQAVLRKQGYHAEAASDGEEALRMAVQTPYDFILCDIRMPVVDGPEFLRRSAEAGISSTIIMMSAYGTVDAAIECMKLGAYDYISKPFKNDEIVLVLKKAEERERLKEENMRLRAEIEREYSFAGIIGGTPHMQDIFSLIRKVCDFKTTVLILGESGTGKELIARAIHFNSIRKKSPFVALNCGAIPENLLESELFGHVKGAFTDAVADKAGLFEQANGGTLLLDEIGEMPPFLQVKLLRVLQEGEFRPVGAGSAKKVDVRVVSATSRDLARDVADGRFREDLFYRLNVFCIKVPSLRERTGDIPLLVSHFLEKYGERLGKTGVRLSSAALKAALVYAWPGNVRELENCIERGLVLCDGDTIDLECLPDGLRTSVSRISPPEIPDDCLSLKRAGEMLEREYIMKALEKTSGNRTHAARILEISHRALLYKLKEYGVE
ncbi:MAG: sigma-54-dependent Fis family transcriptional regulator [Deltaproteobacteria bacterium]|nr:sigma-54-dependent Fis family transcriptional regulator [Deltaproteobacteria bacterium]